jgi:hypothetical protein
MRTSTVIKALLAVAAATPLLCQAESNIQTGANTSNPGATAHVDFLITIPKILYLRVGTGSTYPGTLAADATVDKITFAPAAGALGNGAAVAGTGGDLTGGVETAAIVSNSGDVTLTATASGAGLSNGSGDFIPFSQITTTASTLNSGAFLPAPILTNGTSANVVLTAPANKVIVQDARWTYAYANSTVAPAGTYGGVNTNNSRVVYTATMP